MSYESYSSHVSVSDIFVGLLSIALGFTAIMGIQREGKEARKKEALELIFVRWDEREKLFPNPPLREFMDTLRKEIEILPQVTE